MEVERTIYWSRQRGTVAPLDNLLGIADERYSIGVREMACRLSINSAFSPAGENLLRTAQLRLSHSVLREIVEHEGSRIARAINEGRYGANWTAADCTGQTLVTGADGVMVPLVTEQQKRKRRVTEAQNRRRQGRTSTAGPGRPRSGSDGPYNEFKVVSFYDSDKSHTYAVGTSGDHNVLGRLMRREAGKLRIDQALHKYSVSDGAEWIARQYAIQLPMLEQNILDYYHLRDHVIEAAKTLYGEGTADAQAWREDMMGYVWNQGSLVMLDRLSNYVRRHPSGPKNQALKLLREYVGKRVNMTDYPSYRQIGYDCGSGPTESFCGKLTLRLKGRGMHWDKDNAESMMALAGIYYSNLWQNYWTCRRAA